MATRRRWRRFVAAAALSVALSLLWPGRGVAYSVLTHEELIDIAWDGSIRPLLLARYPKSTEAELRVAHAYAYGGCAIQDMGYYPFGKELFSDLTHYVRSGDFIANLFRGARNVNELAFAIGAMAHYLGDSIGHSVAVNPATGVEFPNLERKFGPIVTYDESPHGHVRTEFGFDIEQLSRRGFAPPAFLAAIGLEVPRELLERTFLQTYGFQTRELLGPVHPALRSYRSSVRKFIPRFANAEVVLHGHQFGPEPQDDAYREFKEHLERAAYERHWSHTYREPGFGAHVLAVLIKIAPKIGPVALLAIKIPKPQTEDWYIRSVNRTVDTYQELLTKLLKEQDTPLALANRDLDTGDRVKPGGYARTDKTYAELLHRLASKPDRVVPERLREDIVDYYADPNAPIVTKKNRRAWEQVQRELEVLRQMKTAERVEAAAAAE